MAYKIKSKRQKIVITGSQSYTSGLYKHLRKEHPSTRKRMKLIKGGK
jgi:hypothetical protein